MEWDAAARESRVYSEGPETQENTGRRQDSVATRRRSRAAFTVSPQLGGALDEGHTVPFVLQGRHEPVIACLHVIRVKWALEPGQDHRSDAATPTRCRTSPRRPLGATCDATTRSASAPVGPPGPADRLGGWRTLATVHVYNQTPSPRSNLLPGRGQASDLSSVAQPCTGCSTSSETRTPRCAAWKRPTGRGCRCRCASGRS